MAAAVALRHSSGRGSAVAHQDPVAAYTSVPDSSVAAPTGSGGLSDFAATDALIAMEAQLRARSTEINRLKEENAKYREREAAEHQNKKSSGHAAQQQGEQSAAMAATLMAQIQFLHGEVERLEKELKTVRHNAAESTRAIHAEQLRVMKEKVEEVEDLSQQNAKLKAQIAPLQRKVGKLDSGEDLFSRCRMLETQLAQAMSERSVAMTEKHQANTRMRKLEAALRGSRENISAVEHAAEEEALAADDEAQSLRNVIQALAAQKNQLQDEITILKERSNRKTASAEVQSELAPLAFGSTQTESQPQKEFTDGICQVDTLRLGIAAATGTSNALAGESAAALLSKYQQKCAENDALRADFDRLTAAHKELLSYSELTKKRLSEEIKQRQDLDEDNEKLLVQLRAAQQQISQLNATIREQQLAVQASEDRAQHAVNASTRMEEDRRQWEADMQSHQHDMQQLVSNQNLANQQMAALSQENENLREEVQQLLRREAQCVYSLKAKDSELQEVIATYQAAVRDSEKHVNNLQVLQRENDNLRGGVAQRQERIISLEDQISQLHAREKQLAVDLQSCDYEGGVMHRKLVQQESNAAALKTEIHDLTNQIAASQRVTFEFERNNAELNKQLVVKENELLLCRSRCDEVEHQLTILQTTHSVEHQRLNELEEHNARLVVDKILEEQRSASGSVGSGASSSHHSAGSQHHQSSPQPTTGSSGSRGGSSGSSHSHHSAGSASTPPKFPHTH